MSSSKFLRVYEPLFICLQKELDSVNESIKIIHDFKEEIISHLEKKKLRLRQQTDSNKIYNDLKRSGKKFVKKKTPMVSSVVKDRVLSLIDREISLIQNQYDLIYNDIKGLKTYLEERIKIVHKTELIMNVLNYKTYEVAYDFRKKIERLNELKMATTLGEGGESQLALHMVEVDKQILECENIHEAQMQSIKEQKLEAQEQYEDVVYVLDNNLETMRKHYNILLQLVEAEKSQLSESQAQLVDVKYSEILAALQQDIDNFTEMQTIGWKIKQPDKLSVLLEARGLKFTSSGLLITQTGERITYEEARDKKLLGSIDFPLDFFKEEEKPEEEASSKESSSSSDFTKMTSEDVEYLKKYVGTPLTLALAEITAVQPRDPIHYLGHWLFKYRYNQEVDELQRIELEQLEDERNRLARERWHKFIEEEARAAVLEMIFRAEEEAMRNELLRIQRQLEAMEEEEEEEDQQNLDDEARDKFDTYGTPGM